MRKFFLDFTSPHINRIRSKGMSANKYKYCGSANLNIGVIKGVMSTATVYVLTKWSST